MHAPEMMHQVARGLHAEHVARGVGVAAVERARPRLAHGIRFWAAGCGSRERPAAIARPLAR